MLGTIRRVFTGGINSRYAFLRQEHPIYARTKAEWARDERRFRGRDGVLQELTRFDWELQDGEHYKSRKGKATYVNFGALKAAAVLGHLMANAPRPGAGLSFGTLGDVRPKEKQRGSTPSRAELVAYNVDGNGNSGSQWDTWWSGVHRWAKVTGHRWLMATTPREAPQNREAEAQGLHPYLVHWSPLRVPNWHFDERGLAFAVVKVPVRELVLDGGQLKGNDGADGYLLLVRRGFGLFGAEFSGGGWWEFTSKLEPTGAAGTWENTRGEIPMWPHFAQRDEGTDEEPAMSCGQLTELMQIAVSLMDICSAADFDAKDAASSIQWLVGVDPAGHNAAMKVITGGGRYVPLQRPTAVAPGGAAGNVDVKDGSMGAVSSEVFERRIQSLLDLAGRHFPEPTSTPGESGESKRVGFAETMGPELARDAAELETSQNTGLHFLELLFGPEGPGAVVVPAAEVQWPRQWNLAPLTSDVDEVLGLQEKAGVSSPTLTAELLALAVEETGLIVDPDTLATIRAELKVAAHDVATATAQANQATAETDALRAAAREARELAPAA